MPSSFDAQLSYPGGVRKNDARGLWKRRQRNRLGKRCAFPTFPQPRRLRSSTWKCYARNPKPGECLIIPGLKMGGRSLLAPKNLVPRAERRWVSSRPLRLPSPSQELSSLSQLEIRSRIQIHRGSAAKDPDSGDDYFVDTH